MPRRSAKAFIHVNQHKIRANRSSGLRDPVITVKSRGDNTYASEVAILDGAGVEVARIVYRPDSPLSCGASVWVEVSDNLIKIIK